LGSCLPTLSPKTGDKGGATGWLIDPQRKLAMIYRPGRESEILIQPEILRGEGPVSGFELKMQRLCE